MISLELVLAIAALPLAVVALLLIINLRASTHEIQDQVDYLNFEQEVTDEHLGKLQTRVAHLTGSHDDLTAIMDAINTTPQKDQA